MVLQQPGLPVWLASYCQSSHVLLVHLGGSCGTGSHVQSVVQAALSACVCDGHTPAAGHTAPPGQCSTLGLHRTAGGVSPSRHQLPMAWRMLRPLILMMFQIAVPPQPEWKYEPRSGAQRKP